MTRPLNADVVIAGAGIIGLSIGLELRRRGLSVVVLERHRAMRASSWAAGGMLAARDSENPPALLPLSLHSLELYPAYLEQVQSLSGEQIPLRTSETLQQVAAPGLGKRVLTAREVQLLVPGIANVDRRFMLLQEESLDPRDLCRALPKAFVAGKGTLLENNPVMKIAASGSGVAIDTPWERIHAGVFINCCGAWAGSARLGGLPVEPVKGQAVNVAFAPDRLRCVIRTPEFYAIPRGDGRVTLGATVQHAGFDETVEEDRIAGLLQTACKLLPELRGARLLESWAGHRPGTPDDLPILGSAVADHCWHATGHYRNGILLAPVTARVISNAIFGELPDVSLEPFSPRRFETANASPASALPQTSVAETAAG